MFYLPFILHQDRFRFPSFNLTPYPGRRDYDKDKKYTGEILRKLRAEKGVGNSRKLRRVKGEVDN